MSSESIRKVMVRALIVVIAAALVAMAWLVVRYTPANVWLTALTAAPVMVLVMGLALLPIVAMAVEGAYLGVDSLTAERERSD